MALLKGKSKQLILLLIAIAAAALLLGVYFSQRPTANSGGKSVTVTVVYRDGSTRNDTYQTDREYLGELLNDEKRVDGEMGDYGLFIKSVDGETAEDSNQEWWCITKGGESLSTSADQTPLEDGAAYELTLTVGY